MFTKSATKIDTSCIMVAERLQTVLSNRSLGSIGLVRRERLYTQTEQEPNHSLLKDRLSLIVEAVSGICVAPSLRVTAH